MNKKEITILIAIILGLIAIGFIMHLNTIGVFSAGNYPSNQGLLIIKRDEDTDADRATYFYFVFDKNQKCTACFCEFVNPREDLKFDEDATFGYINPKTVDNTIYVEYTCLRGRSYEEILSMFVKENETILKSW